MSDKKLGTLARNWRDLRGQLEKDPAPPEFIQKATQMKDLALLEAHGQASSLVASILQRCYYQVATTQQDTMAVALLGDNTSALMFNPYFTIAIGQRSVGFALFHESRHIMYRHLYADVSFFKDPLWTYATEIGINHDAMVRLNRSSLPVYTPEDGWAQRLIDAGYVFSEGEAIGLLDPHGTYKDYVKDLRKQGLDPVSYEHFISTDFVCYSELKRMANPPKLDPKVCVYVGVGDSPDGGGRSPLDRETAKRIVDETLRTLMHDALNGNERARSELLDLADRTGDASPELTKMWGNAGIGRLRGETSVTRRVDWWQQWLRSAMASLLTPGYKLMYAKKRGALDLLLGNTPMLRRQGDEDLMHALIAIDTSASMPDHVVEYLSKLVGHTDGVKFTWLAFDGTIEVFEPGQAVLGGGGTNFDNIMNYAEGRLAFNGATLDTHPDAVIVLTDGGAPPIQPEQPDKWVWLITERGDDSWIRNQAIPMASHRITTGDGV